MERKTIAVFVSALYEDMVRQTVDGMLKAARDGNAKVLFSRALRTITPAGATSATGTTTPATTPCTSCRTCGSTTR